MVTSAKLTKFYTVEEFMALPLDDDKRYELVRGEIEEMSQPGQRHTRIGSRLTIKLGIFLEPLNSAEVQEGGGFELKLPGQERETLRSPDVSVVAKANLADTSGAFQAIPELAVEIYSPNDRPGKLREKLEDYQQAGWNVVWVVYPRDATPKRKAMTVDIYHLQDESGLAPALTLDQNGILQGEGLLEGFSMPISKLFDLATK